MPQALDFVAVGRDYTPTKIFQLLADKVPGITLFVGGGADIKADDTEICDAAYQADILLLGMSHSAEAARAELLAGQAAGKDTMVVLYADAFYCSAREWFTPLRERADLVLTCTPSEAAVAAKLFANAHVASVGHPNWEANYFATLAERKRRAGIRKSIGVRNEDKLVFVSLRKESELNEAHLRAVLEASDQRASAPKRSNAGEFHFRITTHPGELEAQVRKEEYRALVEGRDRMAVVDVPTPKMLAASDLVVNAASGVGTEALYLRLPVVEFLPAIVLDELERLQSGVRNWQPADDGAAIPARTGTEVRDAIASLFADDSTVPTAILEKQRELYPTPKGPGAAVGAMVAEIQRLLTD